MLLTTWDPLHDLGTCGRIWDHLSPFGSKFHDLGTLLKIWELHSGFGNIAAVFGHCSGFENIACDLRIFLCVCKCCSGIGNVAQEMGTFCTIVALEFAKLPRVWSDADCTLVKFSQFRSVTHSLETLLGIQECCSGFGNIAHCLGMLK